MSKKNQVLRVIIINAIIILNFIFCLPKVYAAPGFSIMASNLKLDGQAGWGFYNAGDSPEGAYMGWLNPGVNTITGNINLGRSLPPGSYNVFLKIIDYDSSGQVMVSMGGSQVAINTNDRDENRYWTVGGTITLDSSSSTISLSFMKTMPSLSTQKYLLRGLYITPNLDEIVDLHDMIMIYRYPTAAEMDKGPSTKGNLLENSSFECGISNGWGLDSSARDFLMWDTWDMTVAYHGMASMKIPQGREVISRVFHLKPNKKYTFSAWVKSSVPVGFLVKLVNMKTPPAGFPPRYVISKSFSLSTAWQRISVTGYLLNYPTSDYQIILTVQGGSGNYTWIDAVQLEEGELSSYTTKNPLEIGLVSGHPGNIYYSDEIVTFTLRGYNNSSVSLSRTTKYEVYDAWNRKVLEGTKDIAAPPNSAAQVALNLSLGRKGIFRVKSWLDGQDGSEQETVFSVISRPGNMNGLDNTSLAGIHPNFTDYQLDLLQKLGIKWARAMSPSPFFRWSIAEPTDNNFVWFDAEIQRAARYGISILGTLGTNNYWPSWADQGGLPNLDKWEEFVEQTVTHYRGKVSYWEIWNEPQYNFTSAFYAQMLNRAFVAIRRADPGAKIVGMGGNFNLSWALDVITTLGGNPAQYMDFLSVHLYPPNGSVSADFKREITDRYGIPVWNTETGYWDRGFYMGVNSNWFSGGGAIWPQAFAQDFYIGSLLAPEEVAANFLQSIGGGISNYFYYDSRQYANPGYLRSHTTFIEYDDTIRSKGIAYSTLASFIDHSTGQGNISPDPNTYAYLFDKGGVPLLGLWTKDKTNKVLGISTTAVKAYDMMGNLVYTGSSIPYGRTPIVVVGEGISVAVLRSAVQSGTVSSIGDSTPPNLSIETGPRGPVKATTPSMNFRWIAIDETSIPSAENPNAILYQYRLSGYDNAWSGWTAGTFVNYNNLPVGTYKFEVMAKDQSGNTTPVISRDAIVENAARLLPPSKINVNVIPKAQ